VRIPGWETRKGNIRENSSLYKASQILVSEIPARIRERDWDFFYSAVGFLIKKLNIELLTGGGGGRKEAHFL
jgi:hypothetical protein